MERPALYGWQADALGAWEAAGRRGIVEAVTGTGKTRVGLEALIRRLDAGGTAMVVVPGIELQTQWSTSLRRDLPGSVSIGRLGNGSHDTLASHRVIVAVVDSARVTDTGATHETIVIADECHRYAKELSMQALDERCSQRLGLTATLERPDGEHDKLLGYFGPVCFQMGYAEALTDEIIAHFSVATIGVPLVASEAEQYRELTDVIAEGFFQLTRIAHFPTEPFHLFLRKVKEAAEDQYHPENHTARSFLAVLAKRRMMLANSDSKRRVAARLAPAIALADRALVFTESIDAADQIATALTAKNIRARATRSEDSRATRQKTLESFKGGTVQTLVAPRILDEGVDVPEADFALIVASSKTRRQMVQRMGRILRRKPDGRLARFAILYLEGTTEDPATGAHAVFLSDATALADDVADFGVNELDEAIDFLAIEEPLARPGPPRYEGEESRPAPKWVTDDESLRADEVLGVISQHVES